MSVVAAILAAVVVGTWNGNWFPSGRAKHRAHPAVERATTAVAAEMLADGLKALDPEGTNDVILCLNEMRGMTAASNLVAGVGRKGLRVVAVTGYRWKDRFDEQQDAIATTLPVAEVRTDRWKGTPGLTPPRGYAYAAVILDNVVTAAVYAVHLKSNYGAKKNPEQTKLNREKRTQAIWEFLALEPTRRGKPFRPVILAGDLNADRWAAEFKEEEMFGLLSDAGYANLLSLAPPSARGTYVSRRYGDSAMDYVFCRGLDLVAGPSLAPNVEISDHRALFVELVPSPKNIRRKNTKGKGKEK